MIQILLLAVLLIGNTLAFDVPNVHTHRPPPKSVSFPLPDLVFTVEHSFANHSFSERGSLTVSPSKTSTGDIHGTATVHSSVTFSPEQTKAFKDMIHRQQLYRIRLVSQNSQSISNYPQTWINPCTLVNNQFSELISISINEQGYPLGISYNSPNNNNIQDCRAILDQLEHGITLSSSVQVQSFQSGPRPTVLHVPRQEPTAAEEEPKDVFGYMRKYWYIVLGIFVLLSMNAAA